MSLKQYLKKRNLKKSGEPSSSKTSSKSNSKKVRLSSEAIKKSRPSMFRGRSARKIKGLPCFVVHEHHASHLHWDLRLQMHGVLKSWAIPKQPPRSKGLKRLAIQVEDHPLSYAKFHGIIPEGNYGAGEVKIWDSGTYELIEKTEKSMKIKLHGKRLTGEYVLVKTNYGAKKNGWLFFKI